MAYRNICRLCDHLIISQAVTFADGVLTVNIPAGSYGNGCKYCIVIAQAIPAETTITTPVVITIGTGTEVYPLTGTGCTDSGGQSEDTHQICRARGDDGDRRHVQTAGQTPLRAE